MSLALVLALAVAPSDLGAGLAEIAAAQEHLPLAFVREVGPRLHVVVHERRTGSAMAYYAPAPSVTAVSRSTPDEGGPTGEADGAEPGSGSAGKTASTPSSIPPRLVLYAPYYQRSDGSFRPLLEMTPDVVEYWSHALLLAYLHLEVVDGESEYAQLLEREAVERYPELEADTALGLMVTALASFGSHVLSLANEIERLHRRRPDGDLCALLRARRLHFASWTRAFDEEQYFGVAAEPGGETLPRRALSREDRELFVRTVLEGRWSGDPERDFGSRICGGDPPAVP